MAKNKGKQSSGKASSKSSKEQQSVLSNNTVRLASIILIALGLVGILYGVGRILGNNSSSSDQQEETQENENNNEDGDSDSSDSDPATEDDSSTEGSVDGGVSTEDESGDSSESDDDSVAEESDGSTEEDAEATATVDGSGLSDSGVEKSSTNQSRMIEENRWIATDYTMGDIKSETSEYVVQRGDTLWEIAEAIYGDPYKWVNILSSNSSSIGYLPNGSQALIIPGQKLVIPE